MENRRQFLIENKSLHEASAPPERSETNAPDCKLEICVIFTSVECTIAAMRRAAGLLEGLDGHIRLVDVQSVPHLLPLENPPVSLDFSKRRLLTIAEESPVETSVYVYLCRLPFETLTSILKARSPVVIGCHKGFWPTSEKRLARKLQRDGYDAILVETA